MTGKKALARRLVILSLTLLLSSPALAQSGSDDLPRLENSECPTQALRELGATCHTFHAPENWSAPNGNTISLPVAVLEPEGGQSEESDLPVFFFPGGPGFSSLGERKYLEQLLKDIGNRTLVTMDNRGFIHAEPALECPEYAAVSPYHNIIHTPAITASLDPLERMDIVANAVSDCYHKLIDEGIDVSQYNAHTVSRDVDEIRQLLGYEQINAFGSSTGSGTLVSFIQYYPDSIRAAILGWAWYNHLRNRPPVDEFYTAKQLFTDTLSLCTAEDEACRELLPNWFQAIDRARRTLDSQPFVTQVERTDGSEKTLYFDGAAFLDTLYLTLASDYAELPSIVADIETGDYSRLPAFFRIEDYTPEPEAPTYALGYFLAHACGDMGANRPSVADSTSAVVREPAVLGFEPIWLCAWWGKDGDVPSEHNDPPISETPALALHGEMDPCCTPRWSEHLRRTMPNLQYVVYQGLGHNPINECRSTMIQAFLDDPLRPIDASCHDEVTRQPWVIEPQSSQASNSL